MHSIIHLKELIMNKVESPCIRNCCLNEDEVCVGCLRSLNEIIEWGEASDEEKKAILERIKHKKNA
jgi:predicted Fe-S protein YdhL (DUF1289 family)